MKDRGISYCVILMIMFCMISGGLRAQLISPGKLSSAHSFLEGVSHCTSCHELRNPEISNDKCTTCHTPIQSSIDNLEGIHGTEDVIGQNCASCHKEHFGQSFDVLHFDSTDFDHSVTGFELDNAHAELNCESCHSEPSFQEDEELLSYQKEFDLVGTHSTFLGLNGECASCHISDNVHGDQFLDESCAACHNTVEFSGADNFDHNEAGFMLTGAHLDVECSSCHKEVVFKDTMMTQFVNIESGKCIDCHEDVHEGRLTTMKSPPQTCESCHNTTDWHSFNAGFSESSFDHSETGYPLVGAHSRTECESCHTRRDDETISNTFVSGTQNSVYPKPLSDQCKDCHVDYHEGVFDHAKENNDCESCHTEETFYPSTFGLEAHNNRSRFMLVGAHVATPCFSCHQPSLGDLDVSSTSEKPKFSFSDISCESCHNTDNPHGDLATLWEASNSEDCSSCHSERSWTDEITFEHEAVTGYALTGAHELVNCSGCHFDEAISGVSTVERSFNVISTECTTCHETDSPHEGQFELSTIGAACNNCHTTQSFTMSEFDHERTAFSLDGAHSDVACISCHTTEVAADSTLFTRFFPLSTECSTCHEN